MIVNQHLLLLRRANAMLVKYSGTIYECTHLDAFFPLSIKGLFLLLLVLGFFVCFCNWSELN